MEGWGETMDSQNTYFHKLNAPGFGLAWIVGGGRGGGVSESTPGISGIGY